MAKFRESKQRKKHLQNTKIIQVETYIELDFDREIKRRFNLKRIIYNSRADKGWGQFVLSYSNLLPYKSGRVN